MGWKLSQPTDETGQFTLKLKGNLAADAVIPTLNGTLIGKKMTKRLSMTGCKTAK